ALAPRRPKPEAAKQPEQSRQNPPGLRPRSHPFETSPDAAEPVILEPVFKPGYAPSPAARRARYAGRSPWYALFARLRSLPPNWPFPSLPPPALDPSLSRIGGASGRSARAQTAAEWPSDNGHVAGDEPGFRACRNASWVAVRKL